MDAIDLYAPLLLKYVAQKIWADRHLLWTLILVLANSSISIFQPHIIQYTIVQWKIFSLRNKLTVSAIYIMH